MPFSERGDQGPRPVGASLEAVSKRLGLSGANGTGMLFSRWAEIVGATMADHVRPLRLDEECLIVGVDHPAWATQVRRMGDPLLDRVADAVGGPRPARIEVRVRPEAPPDR